MNSWFEFLNATSQSVDLFIYDEIGMWGVTADDFRKDLTEIKSKNIILHINSPGGNVFDGIAIYNLLKSHSATVTTKIDGVAASIASMIALAGDTVEIAEAGMFMIHPPLAGAFRNAKGHREVADILDKIRDQILNVYVAKTGGETLDINALLEAETWMKAQEAVDLGFCDSIYNGVKAAASFDMSKFDYKNTPKNLFSKPVNKIKEPVNKPKTGEKPMNLEELKAKHPDLYNQIMALGKAAGEIVAVEVLDAARLEAAAAERKRIQDIEAIAVPGAEAIISEAKFKPEANAGTVGLEILAAAKEKKIVLVNKVVKDGEDLDNLENKIDGQGADTKTGTEAEDKADCDAMVAGMNE